MKRRTFLLTPIAAVAVTHTRVAESAPRWKVIWEFAALVLTAINEGVDLISKFIGMNDTETEGDCTTIYTYTFNGINCLECGSCVAFLENGMVEEAAMTCPTESITVTTEIVCKQ